MRPLPLLLCTALAMAGLHAAASRVTLEVYPRVAMAPAALKLTAKVEPQAKNRLLAVVLDCERFYDSTSFELEGAMAAKTYQLRLIEGIPEGPCRAQAFVFDDQGKMTSSTPVDVSIVGGEPRP